MNTTISIGTSTLKYKGADGLDITRKSAVAPAIVLALQRRLGLRPAPLQPALFLDCRIGHAASCVRKPNRFRYPSEYPLSHS
ncbi:MAG: hypothetical protein ABI690_19565 [Chloroflexota bacterium]